VAASTSVAAAAAISDRWRVRVVPARRSATWLQNGAAATAASALAPSTRPIWDGEKPRSSNQSTKNGMNAEPTIHTSA
jgi:hypothetical protein